VRNRSGIDIPAPRVVGELRRPAPVQVEDVRFLRAATDRAVNRALALAYAEVVRAEIADLFAAGADIVQLDEPCCRPGRRWHGGTASRC